MHPTDKAKFSRILATMAEVYGRTITPELTAVYWSVFSKYPMEQIEQAARKHVETAKFFPSPAELLEYMPAARANQHVGADEAWSIAIESFDEERTVVMTPQISEARGVALPIYQSGDEIGARVAFRDAYNRIVKTAGEPVWFVSAGHDGARRADAIARAASMGRIAAHAGGEYSLGHDKPTATVSGLLERLEQHIERTETDVEKAKQNIAGIKAMLNKNNFANGIAEREAKRKDFELHRQQELAKLASKAGGLH